MEYKEQLETVIKDYRKGDYSCETTSLVEFLHGYSALNVNLGFPLKKISKIYCDKNIDFIKYVYNSTLEGKTIKVIDLINKSKCKVLDETDEKNKYNYNLSISSFLNKYDDHYNKTFYRLVLLAKITQYECFIREPISLEYIIKSSDMDEDDKACLLSLINKFTHELDGDLDLGSGLTYFKNNRTFFNTPIFKWRYFKRFLEYIFEDKKLNDGDAIENILLNITIDDEYISTAIDVTLGNYKKESVNGYFNGEGIVFESKRAIKDFRTEALLDYKFGPSYIEHGDKISVDRIYIKRYLSRETEDSLCDYVDSLKGKVITARDILNFLKIDTSIEKKLGLYFDYNMTIAEFLAFGLPHYNKEFVAALQFSREVQWKRYNIYRRLDDCLKYIRLPEDRKKIIIKILKNPFIETRTNWLFIVDALFSNQLLTEHEIILVLAEIGLQVIDDDDISDYCYKIKPTDNGIVIDTYHHL